MMTTKPQTIEGQVEAISGFIRREIKGEATAEFLINNIKEVIQSLQDQRADVELSRFSYIDWKVGDDNKLRVGDHINLNFQHPYDGSENNIDGVIELHEDNQMPVILLNQDGKGGGDYVSVQQAWLDGYEFTRIAPPAPSIVFEYRRDETRDKNKNRWVSFYANEPEKLLTDEEYKHQDDSFAELCGSDWCRCSQ